MENLTPYSEQERNLLREQFSRWKTILDQKGINSHLDPDVRDFIDKEHEFFISQKNDPNSLFTCESVRVAGLKKPLEEYGIVPEGFKSEDGENWLEFSIDPKDRYRPRLFRWAAKEYSFFTDCLHIDISSNGRAFERTTIGEVPVYHEPTYLHRYMKTIPQPLGERVPLLKGEIDLEQITILEKEPAVGEENLEPFQPLRGQSFERLKFLLTQAERGNVIEN